MKTIITLLVLLWALGLQAQQSENDSAVFILFENKPEFPGGSMKYADYLHSMQYPRQEVIGTSCKAYLRFIVEKNGDIGDVELAKSSGSEILDGIAITHIQRMPQWKPGYLDGEPVRVSEIIVIFFWNAGK